MKQTAKPQHTNKNLAISYIGYRFPPELISYAVWFYFRFPLSLRMVEEMTADRGIEVTYETPRRWARKFVMTSIIFGALCHSALVLSDKISLR